MADSQRDSKTFTLRIVSIDYYMAPPIPGLDICYSSFHGGKVKEVPVIRIYGSTPAGQKTCLHIHRALPYLYVPCADIPGQPDQPGDAYTYTLSASLEKALKLKGSAGSTRQHVHGCSLVRAKKFYGYHSSEELFVKIYLYQPHDVPRAANLLLGGAVLDKSLQPHESHIPFILQFLVDYNLHGMGYVHLSKMKFRHPITYVSFDKKFNCNSQQSDPGGDVCVGSPMWISSNIPSDWMWQPPSELGASSNHDAYCPKRQSICELEGDASVDEILNQQFKMYTSLSQTSSDFKMVQSLIPIWEEQQERIGICEATISPDTGKLLPDEVLKSLSMGLDFEKLFFEFCSEATTSSFSNPSEKKLRETDIIGSASPPGSLCEGHKFHGGAIDSSIKLLTVNELQSSEMIGTLDVKATDREALNLLKWLASSQAAEDMNSDDDLVCETILSPLLPAATIDKILEKANMDYENESQKECQDILDSIDDTNELELPEENPSFSSNLSHCIQVSLNNMIPQVDGSGDDGLSSPSETSSAIGINGESKVSSEYSSLQNIDTSIASKNKGNKLWGSLPLSVNQMINNEQQVVLCMEHSFQSETGDSVGSAHLTRNEVENGFHNLKSGGKGVSDSKEIHTFVNCSVRDMMRRKRCYRVEQDESDSSGIIKKLVLDRDEKQNRLCFETLQTGEEKREVGKNCDPEVGNPDYLVHGKLHHQADNDGCLQTCLVNDEHFGQRVVDGSEAIPVSRNIIDGDSSQMHPGLGFHEPKTLHSTASINHSVVFSGKMLNVSTAQAKPIARDEYMLKQDSFFDVPFLRTAAEHKVRVPERCQKTHFAASSSAQSFTIDDRMSVQDNSMLKSSLESRSYMQHGQIKSYENALGAIALSDMQVLQSEKKDNQKPGEISVLCDSVGLESVVDDQDGKALDDFLPFSERNTLEEMETRNKCVTIGGSGSDGKKALGVTTHYKNDGSHLYLLTPKILPPSVGSVRCWLSCDDRDQMHQETDEEDKVVPECSSGPCLRPSQGQVDQYIDAEKNSSCISGGLKGIKKCLDGLQDISQISGPSEKLRSTPLSQIGYRDPASVGGGQQLTLLSIEALAESRGDLLPDPRFDAINVLALGFQNDHNSIIEVLVLLHSKLEYHQRSFDGLPVCDVLVFTDEKELLNFFIKIVSSSDPDILMGWDVQGGSLGFLAERASHLGLGLINSLSRTPSESWVASQDTETSEKEIFEPIIPDTSGTDCGVKENSIIENEWGHTHASGVNVGGRIVLNVWQLIRGEIKLNLYTVEAVAESVLRRKVPSVHYKVLTKWFSSGPGRARYQCIKYIIERAKLNLEILNQLDMVNRTSELARVFGIDFFSVVSRGSQYRVESMFLRLAHTQNYLAVSPGNQQVASQPAMECLPLVMEPESGFYSDPVVVLDFQSLYPSMIIAYNLCYCTCLGNVMAAKSNTLGVCSFSPEQHVLQDLKDKISLTPNGVMFVPSKVRRGVLPRLLEEILSTRILVKQAMKKLAPSEQVLQRIFNARQLALKLIANVTYGYTAAGFSGRMPCAELADSIVQCGRSTLEKAISFVNGQEKWNAKVIYGDTDSMFVLLKGRTIEESFQIGNEIASAVTAMNPSPVTLKMEKVYHPCFLLTKKRYVGYSYESPDQIEPVFDAKGIETVRRDTCGAVSKIMEQSLRLFFEHQDLSEVKTYLQRQWKRILSGRVSLKDFVFAKEVRLGTYNARSSSLPPAAIVATKAMRVDPRAAPRYAERIPYIVIHGGPGARLIDMVVDPLEVLGIDSPYRINDLYYINKQIIPALQRVFGLVGADLNQWFSEMPRSVRAASAKHPVASNLHRTRIDYYYLSKHCILCGGLVQASDHLCSRCSENGVAAATALISKTSKLEEEMQHLVGICHHCGGGDRLLESGVKCTSISCSVFYERRKVQKELLATNHVAASKGFYPRCAVEWF